MIFNLLTSFFQITSVWDCYVCGGKNEPLLVDEYGKTVNVYRTSREKTFYWQLPAEYSGNKVTITSLPFIIQIKSGLDEDPSKVNDFLLY